MAFETCGSCGGRIDSSKDTCYPNMCNTCLASESQSNKILLENMETERRINFAVDCAIDRILERLPDIIANLRHLNVIR